MADTTSWRCVVDPVSKKASLEVKTNIGFFLPHTIKGVCYSPAPINGSNKYGPALGDWFWDDFDQIEGWSALWRRDLHLIRRGLSANSIRIYCSLSRQLDYRNGKIPIPWDSGHKFTHNRFLDFCWDAGNEDPDGPRPLFVLVGIPLPANMFNKNQYDQTSDEEKAYWTNVLRETAETMGQHPAVMGFTVQNEQDGSDVCYDNPVLADFWWGQIEKMAAIVKTAAPTKIVGFANHEDGNMPSRTAQYMANCPHVDFWGVNSYQTETFDHLFSRFSALTGPALKPVILTEFGLPATGHKDPNNLGSIYEDNLTRFKTAEVIGQVLPKAFQSPIGLGVFYFEFCDEWWNQPESPNIFTWFGGPAASGFPNGYWDNDGFGLYAIRRGDGLPNDAPIWVGAENRPNTPIDEHTERGEITSVVRSVFSNPKI